MMIANNSLKLTWELAKIQDGQGHPDGHSYSEIISRQLSSEPLASFMTFYLG
jgi:hypothetical protein